MGFLEGGARGGTMGSTALLALRRRALYPLSYGRLGKRESSGGTSEARSGSHPYFS